MSIALGVALVGVSVGFIYLFFHMFTLQINEQSEIFILKFGKFVKSFRNPGLYFLPSKILPWINLITVSRKIDYRTYKEIQVNDRFGTTMVIDLWIEFRIADPYKALFGVEDWEDVLNGVVIHSTASILCSLTVDEILKHRSELAEQLRASLAVETDRWGIHLLGAMIQNIGVLPEISKQFLNTVAARIEKTKAIVQEEGRLRVAKLDALTSKKIADLNGQARSQLPLEIGNFYHGLAADFVLQKKFQEYWELQNLDPRKTVTFVGFKESPISLVEASKAIESVMTH
jgi:regulator of protease activity HflC (stomatin/prohibitin superfamily)